MRFGFMFWIRWMCIWVWLWTALFCEDVKCTQVVSLPLYQKQSEGTFTSRHQRVPFSVRVNNTQVPLFGGITSVGEYYLTITVGGQPVSVQVDTGSSTLVLPLHSCKSCLHTSYSLEKSTSTKAKEIGCASNACQANTFVNGVCPHQGPDLQCCMEKSSCFFLVAYADGSGAQGSLVEDEIQIGEIKTQAVFGGMLTDFGDFQRRGVDGILGLAYPPLACNPTCLKPVFDEMVGRKKVKEDMFSICFAGAGGSLVLGGFDAKMAKSRPFYVPLLKEKERSFYRVGLNESLIVGGVEVSMPEMKTAIVDSGTTLIMFSKNTFDKLAKHLKTAHCDVPDLCERNSWFQEIQCFTEDEEILDKMPTIEIPFSNGEKLELEARDYLIPIYNELSKFRCVGMGTMGSDADVILGNTINTKYLTIYDRQRERMGFAVTEKNCGRVLPTSSDQTDGSQRSVSSDVLNDAPKRFVHGRENVILAGGAAGCSVLKTCADCAANFACAYSYKTKLCLPRAEHDTLIPYPYCHGDFCYCSVRVYFRP
uniref:Peptidase A1 domain-containing protein n=2 Tax=Rhodosorus marinus TaxID=101924 RepID=A0A7S3A5Q4_9RHOD|mmetsp:Transcript_44718/g.173466  ORF Transcript_44718/g.173466 Transcript_44718/m.173466 type:complete len:536 (+) Transcript_44718:467-2074(+)